MKVAVIGLQPGEIVAMDQKDFYEESMKNCQQK